MKNLIHIFIKRPVTVIMIMAAVIIAAMFAFSSLPLDRLPELSVPRVTVETVYYGMAADEVRALVTVPIEDSFSSVKGLERMRSISRDGSSIIRLDFRWGTDPMAASALVREAVDSVYPSLPHGILKPVISPGDSGPEPHMIIAVRSLTGDENFSRRFADVDLRSMIRRIEGAGSVLLAGGETTEGHLRLDVPRLAALELSPPELVRLLSGETADIPAGNAHEGLMELVVVSSGRPGGIEELKNLILPSASGPLSISDIGELILEPGRKKSIFVYNGKEVTALEVYRRAGTDPVRLSREIKKVVKELNKNHSHHLEISLVRDSSPGLVISIVSLGISALLAALAVIAVLLIFFRRLRSSILAALSIPFSAAAGICILALTGRTLNCMSLGGLALSIGLVSDISVIMLDLLNRSFCHFLNRPTARETGDKAATIAGSSISSTVTTAVVFVPVIFLPGALGSLFGDTAIALVSTICAGWFYAQFCLPSLYLFTFNKIYIKKSLTNDNPGSKKVETAYGIALSHVLRNPRKWFVIAGMASLAGALLLVMRPAVFVNPDSAEEIQISLDFPSGAILESIGSYGAEFSQAVMQLPFVETVYGRAGAENDDPVRRAEMDYRKEELIINCVIEKGIKPEKALELIKNFVAAQPIHPDASYSVYLPKDRTESLLGLSSAYTFAVMGKDREEGQERAVFIANKLNEINPSEKIRLRPDGKRPELRLYPDRETSAFFGVSAAEAAEHLFIISEGIVASGMEIEGQPLEIRVSGNSSAWKISGNDSIENIPIKTSGGKMVFLGSLGRIERLEADAALARLDRSDVIYADISHDKKQLKKANEFGKIFSWFGKADESVFDRYRYALILNILLALVLIYMAMGAQFESFVLPLVLMLTIPFSLAGAGPALLVFNCVLDSGAIIGICALFGLVVNNGLILFEISEENLNYGLPPYQSVYNGASLRLRPVLITFLTTAFALLPVILNPLGSTQKSMAVAMLGGMAVSTCLSLFLLPPVFIRFFAWRNNK